ncbi:DoxX family membrane protein, partial [Aquiluna sp.]|nr:DoxX family membrane protein [Aquiluna sp.]
MKVIRTLARVLLGGALMMAGVGHLTDARQEFQAQVPVWLPLDPDFVVVASGIVEILLGLSLLTVGWVVPWAGLVTALFF